MEMVQQRKQGPGGKPQGPSTSRGLTWADLGAMHHADNARVSSLSIICNGEQRGCKRSDDLFQCIYPHFLIKSLATSQCYQVLQMCKERKLTLSMLYKSEIRNVYAIKM